MDLSIWVRVHRYKNALTDRLIICVLRLIGLIRTHYGDSAKLVRICTLSLTCCAGCLSSLINAGEDLFNVLEGVEVVFSPTFMDTKEIQRVDIAVVEGGVRTVDDEELIREMRAKTDTLVALGMCATHGGVTSLGNILSLKSLLEKRVPEIQRSTVGPTPLPDLEDMMYPICTFVDVDYYVPGCPPMPPLIIKTLKSLIGGEKPERFKEIVCYECPRKILPVKPGRLFGITEKESDPNVCLLSQGFICLGSLTRRGCGAPCPQAGFTCFGCRGPPDALLYKSRDLHDFLIRVTSRRTGIPIEEVRDEIYSNPFIFHTFMFSDKVERFKSRERVV